MRISMCHCLACQRRTGSAFGVQARWPRDQVESPDGTRSTSDISGRRGADVSLLPGLRRDGLLDDQGLARLDRGRDRRVCRSFVPAADSLRLRVATVSVAIPSGRDGGGASLVHAVSPA